MSSWREPNRVAGPSPDEDYSRSSVIVYGIPRCGTTWVYQIACDVLGGGVVKTHDWIEAPGVPVISCCRDLRDCIVSHWRFRRPDQVEKYGVMPRTSIFFLAGGYNQSAWVWNEYRLCRGTFNLRYEEILADPALILEQLEQATGAVAVDGRAILAAHTIERNRAISDGVEPWQAELLIDPGHVHEGEVGTWRRFVDDNGADLITELTKDWLVRMGYTP